MRSLVVATLSLLLMISCTKTVRTQLSEAVLNEAYVGLDRESKALGEILSEHTDKQIVVAVWASWCRDCIVGFPEIKRLQEEKPDAIYLFLSADRNEKSWKRAIEKYNIKGEHYFMPKGTNSRLGDFVDIDWIPRYMIVDADGNIQLFEAIKADDPIIRSTLK